MTRKFGYLYDPTVYEAEHPKEGTLHKDLNADSLYLGGLGGKPLRSGFSDLVLSVLDQGSIGSCVANAGMQAIRILSQQALGSRLWGYWLARSYHQMQDFDTGTHLRTFFRAMNKYGFMRETDYKYGYDVSKYGSTPPPLAFRQAFDQRDTETPIKYYRIFDQGEKRLELIRGAITEGYPVVFGTDVSNDFVRRDLHNTRWGTLASDAIQPPQGDIAGGHAMCITAFNEHGFRIVNSWGKDWGNNGFACLSNDYMTWEHTRDLWVVRTAPRYSTP